MNRKVLIKVMASIALIFAFATASAQESKTMYIMKDGVAISQYAVSDIDSIIFYAPTTNPGIGEATSTTDPGVVINGVRWATRNVDAPNTFVSSPEDPGMFYQWNSNVGWSRTEPPTPSDGTSTWNSDWNGNNATTWETANNVCPAGWHVPTKDELTSLADAGYNFSSNGRIFGTSPNTLFLPVTGFIRTQGVSVVMNLCSYWSSTIGEQYNYVYGFLPNQNGGDDFNERSRAFGHNVRCVANE